MDLLDQGNLLYSFCAHSGLTLTRVVLSFSWLQSVVGIPVRQVGMHLVPIVVVITTPLVGVVVVEVSIIATLVNVVHIFNPLSTFEPRWLC